MVFVYLKKHLTNHVLAPIVRRILYVETVKNVFAKMD
jgi:hypothetical protein